MKKFLLLLPLLTILFASCKKEVEQTPPATVKDKLIKGIWKMSQAGEDINKNNTLETAEQEVLDACEKDDTYQYKSDQTLVILDNAIKCDPGDPNTTTLNWALTAGDTELILSQTGVPISFNFKILELNDNILRVSFVDAGDQYIIVYGR